MALLRELIQPASLERCGDRSFPVLSMTMHDGIMLQSDRFKKSLASVDQSAYKVVRRNQLVVGFPIDEGVLYIQQVADAGIMSPAYDVWNVDETKVNLQYFELCLHSPQSMMFYRTNLRGTTARRRSLPKETLLSLPVPVPSMERQREIASTIARLKELIELRQRQLRTLDTLIKARFVEMFGDPVTNPKGWEKRALSDEAEIRIGPFGSLLHKEDYITGGHALINPSHIVDGRISPDTDLTLTDEKFEELAPYHLIEGDVVMGRRGEMGRCAVVDRPGLLCGTGSLLIRSKGDLSADYIQKIISFPSFKRTIEDMAVGQTMPNLNVPIVSAFQIIKPPKTVQEQYYKFVSQVDKSKVVEVIVQRISDMRYNISYGW